MSLNAGTIYVDVKPDTSAMSGKSSGLGSMMKTAGLVAAGAFAVSFAKGAYEEAAEAEKVGLAFADAFSRGTEKFNSDKLATFFDKINNAMGISDEELQTWATHLNNAIDFNQFGKNGEKMLKDMTALIPNLAAQSGKSTSMVERTIKTIGTAPEAAGTALRKLGALTDDQVKHYDKLVEKGKIVKAQQYAVAKATENTAGAAEKQTTPMEKLSITWAELQETVGSKVLPMLQGFADKMVGVIKWFTSGTTGAKVFIAAVGALVATIATLKVVSVGMTVAVNAWATAVKVWNAIVIVARNVQMAWNLAVASNPIGMVVLAIVALIAIIVLLWKKNEAFRTFVLKTWAIIQMAISKVWQVIKAVAIAVWNAIKKAVSVAVKVIGAYIKAYLAVVKVVFNAVKAVVTAVWNTIKSVASSVWKGITGIVRAWWDGVSGIIGKAKDAFTGIWDGVLEAAKGAFNGIASAWNSTVGKISFTIPSWVPKIGGNTWSVPDIPMLAEGGIVTGPTLAMIGERGKEAVIPLDKGGMTVRIVDSNLGLVMQGTLEEDKRYGEQRGRAHR